MYDIDQFPMGMSLDDSCLFGGLMVLQNTFREELKKLVSIEMQQSNSFVPGSFVSLKRGGALALICLIIQGIPSPYCLNDRFVSQGR